MVAYINFMIGLILYCFPYVYLNYGIPVFILTLIGLAWNVQILKNDFLAQMRLMFLAAIGFYAAFTKLIGPDIAFLHFGLQIQTFEIGVKMFSLTLLAMAGSMIGYHLTPNLSLGKTLNLVNHSNIKSPEIFHALTLILIVVIAWLSALSYGPTVWEAAYASGGGQGQLLGNLQSMGVILIGLNFLFAKKINKKTFWIASWIAFSILLIWGILIRGGRLEFLAGILTIFIAHKVIKGEKRIFPLRYYFLLFFAALLMEYWGHLRYSLSEDGPKEGAIEGILRMLDDGVFFVGTMSGIGSAFANILHMLQFNVIDFQWGGPYFDYILRTPPSFIYPDRPKDLSSLFEEYGYISIGGFFELAEAYLSFGLLGVIIIPAIISCLFKYLQNKAINGSLLHYILLLSILSVFMRGAWYQTFAYYKAMVTGLIIYILLFVVILIFRGRGKAV